MITYISGPMTNIPDLNKPKFMQTERKLAALGYTVLNPACLPSSPEITHEQHMIIDLATLSICDGIYMLDGWKNSIGAKIEYNKALDDGLVIFFEGDFVPEVS